MQLHGTLRWHGDVKSRNKPIAADGCDTCRPNAFRWPRRAADDSLDFLFAAEVSQEKVASQGHLFPSPGDMRGAHRCASDRHEFSGKATSRTAERTAPCRQWIAHHDVGDCERLTGKPCVISKVRIKRLHAAMGTLSYECCQVALRSQHQQAGHQRAVDKVKPEQIVREHGTFGGSVATRASSGVKQN